MKFTLGLLCACSLLIVSCGFNASNPVADPGLSRSTTQNDSIPKAQASLDIFSGSPNPFWDLSDAAAVRLVDELAQLKTTPSREGPDPDSGLGYRGFIVEITEKASGSVRRLAIYRGGIQETGWQTTFYQDPDRKIEKLLLDSARPHIDAELYTYVEAEIQN
ncbi:MAG TPA: hypothetical protein VJG32_08875 [Anaerolineae bacterium]|nr:hypothetical protein [Anaerolineae bacterium]